MFDLQCSTTIFDLLDYFFTTEPHYQDKFYPKFYCFGSYSYLCAPKIVWLNKHLLNKMVRL